MTDIDQRPVSDLIGRDVVDPDGDKIGTVTDVYLDNETGQPEWLAVSTGLFGTKVSFVPLAGASARDDDVVVPHTKETVKDAPRAEADGELSAEEEDALYAHYGSASSAAASDVDIDRETSTSATVDVGTNGRDTSGPETDEAMTRSEEELDVQKRTRQTGTARLRKWVETENVQMTVPIRREKARLVVEPVTEANADAAYAGGDLTSEEHEITLSEEVVDIDKRVVAKERVRLETDVQTEDVVVDEEVRKERVEMDDEPEMDQR